MLRHSTKQVIYTPSVTSLSTTKKIEEISWEPTNAKGERKVIPKAFVN